MSAGRSAKTIDHSFTNKSPGAVTAPGLLFVRKLSHVVGAGLEGDRGVSAWLWGRKSINVEQNGRKVELSGVKWC